MTLVLHHTGARESQGNFSLSILVFEPYAPHSTQNSTGEAKARVSPLASGLCFKPSAALSQGVYIASQLWPGSAKQQSVASRLCRVRADTPQRSHLKLLPLNTGACAQAALITFTFAAACCKRLAPPGLTVSRGASPVSMFSPDVATTKAADLTLSMTSEFCEANALSIA